MNKFRTILAITVLSTALGFSSCSQDETMDEVLKNTEINSPTYMDDTTGGGNTGNSGNEDKPGVS